MLVGIRGRAPRIVLSWFVLVALAACTSGPVPPSNSLSSPMAVSATAPATNSLSSPMALATPNATSPMPSALASDWPSGRPTDPQPEPTPTQPELGPNGFPVAVEGFPVISVAQANRLLDDGRLDGRLVAIAGFYSSAVIHCYSGALPDYPGPLQTTQCRFEAFADDANDAHICHSLRNGESCRWPGPGAPFWMRETLGAPTYSRDPKDPFAPLRIVVIAHADDPRQWQCTASAEEECSRALVVDRYAWVNGQSITPDEPALWDDESSRQLPLRMGLSRIEAALGPQDLVTAAPFQAKDVWAIDPRWNLVGDEPVWVARSVRDEPGSQDPTRAAQVSLVNDVTGAVIDSHDLAIDATYAPARLWLDSVRRDLDALGNVPDELMSFYRIRSSDGTSIHETGPYYWPGSSLPALLPSGDYTVETWLASDVDGVEGLPTRSCAMDVHLNALDDVSLLATYAQDSQCSFTTLSPPA